jgi:uncharacterized membrane protein YeaQ/YmgE (transglycosylase-associated protein family)
MRSRDAAYWKYVDLRGRQGYHRRDSRSQQSQVRALVWEAAAVKINLDDIITWLIVGALAGSLAGMVVKGHRAGFGRLINLAIGLVGALIGGFLFKLFHIDLGIVGQITVTSEEVVTAFIGSLIFLALVWFIRKLRAAKNTTIGGPA